MAFKVGDRVTVYRPVRVGYWLKDMDKLVGRSGTIIGLDEKESVQVSFDYHSQIDNYFHIPKTALKYERK